MYTAIVLICMGGVKDPGNCYTYTHEILHESVAICEETIFYAIRNEIFTISDPETGLVERPADWYCVNWNAVRITY